MVKYFKLPRQQLIQQNLMSIASFWIELFFILKEVVNQKIKEQSQHQMVPYHLRLQILKNKEMQLYILENILLRVHNLKLEMK